MVQKRRAIFLSIALSLGYCFQQMSGARGPMASAADSISAVTPEIADSLRQQALVDSLMSKDLGEVTVEAQNRYVNAETTVFLPTARQKNTAQTVTDLLRAIGIPQIQINPQTDAVTDNFGNNVALFINYMPATEEDRQGLRTADVRKVEYLEFPTDPRFRGAEKAINFIVQEYEYGGYTKLYTRQTGTHVYYGDNSVFSKFAYKRMTYDVFANMRYIHDSHFGFSESRIYTLANQDGKPYDFNRNQTFDGGYITQKQVPVTLRATYSSDKVQIRNTVGYSFRSTPEFYYHGRLFTSATPGQDNTISRSTPERSNNISYTGDYYFALGGNFRLDCAPEFHYSHNHGYYDYQSPLDSPVRRENREDAYSYNVSLSLSKDFNAAHSAALYLDNRGDFNNVVYELGQPADPQKFRTWRSGATLNYTFKTGSLFLSTRLGVAYDVTKNNLRKITDVYPTASISSRYAFDSRNSANFRISYGGIVPLTAYKTDEIIKTYDMLYQTGNPALENYRRLNAELGYNWMPSNALSLAVFGSFTGEFDRVIRAFDHWADGSAILQSYMNDGNFYVSKIGGSMNLNLLRNSLNFYLSPSITFYKSTGLYSRSSAPFNLYVSATYYLGNFYFQGYYQPAYRSMGKMTASAEKSRPQYGLSAGWSRSGWNVQLAGSNFFNRGYVSSTSDMSVPLVKSLYTSYDSFCAPMVALSVTYTVGYGRKIRRGDEVGEQQGASSAIMK